MEEMGLSHILDRRICLAHIDDYAIKGLIRRESWNGVCSYCGRKKSVTSFNKLMPFIMKGIRNYYTEAVNFMSYDSREGGYLGETFDTHELIIDEIGLDSDNQNVINDIIDCIEDSAWTNPNTYYDSEGDILQYHWNDFKQVVKHKSRYFFSQPRRFKTEEYNRDVYKILDEIGKGVTSLNLLTHLPASTELFRCRQHEDAVHIMVANEIVSPPEEYAISHNRMSPAGISMFYCAFDSDTAKIETINVKNHQNSVCTSAVFKTNTRLSMVDFTKLPRLPSIFDLKAKKKFYLINFLQQFVRDLSRPIAHDGKEHIEYIPTQVITEFFRFTYAKSAIDGIIYPSSRIGGKACVLFMDHEESLANLEFVNTALVREKINFRP